LSSGAASLQELSSSIGVPARTLGIVTAAMLTRSGHLQQRRRRHRGSSVSLRGRPS
jgi:hypothetical protein